MTATGDSATTQLKADVSIPPPANLLRRRRYSHLRCLAWVCCALLFLVALVLALTVFKTRDLATTLASVSVAGVAPRVTLPAARVELNVTLELDILVDNPNRVAFSHDPGRVELFYGSALVGVADVAPGRIPSRGSAHVHTRLTLEAERFAADIGGLAADVFAGRLEVDTSTRIPGRVVFLGFIKRHVVAVSDCRFVLVFPSLRVLDQRCQQKTMM